MSGLGDFLQHAKAAGRDQNGSWEVVLNDGTSERGRIVEVLSDAVLLEDIVKRNSANTRYQAVQVLEDVIRTLVPFTSIRLVRALETPGTAS
jgi:hypothetical protein